MSRFIKTPDVWFTSDSHFSHRNMTEVFMHGDKRVRHEFQTVEECDEAMVDRWNKTVKPGDKVYHLGDFAFDHRIIKKFRTRLNGSVSIILGNHDPVEPWVWDWKLPSGQHAFRKVQSWQFFGPQGSRPIFVACHYPLHPMCITEHHNKDRQLACVHGHEHRNLVPFSCATPRQFLIRHETGELCDGRYINICVENTNYTPVHYDEIVATMKKRGFDV